MKCSTNVDDALTISINDSPQQPNLGQMPFWVCKGLNNTEIASQLYCSDLTIK